MQLIILAGTIGIIFGAVFLLLSNMLYYRRTREKYYLKRIWLPKHVLTTTEYILNRSGFALAYGILSVWIVGIMAWRFLT